MVSFYLQLLLENNVNVKAENKAGYTAVHLAAKNGHLESLQVRILYCSVSYAAQLSYQVSFR